MSEIPVPHPPYLPREEIESNITTFSHGLNPGAVRHQFCMSDAGEFSRLSFSFPPFGRLWYTSNEIMESRDQGAKGQEPGELDADMCH